MSDYKITDLSDGVFTVDTHDLTDSDYITVNAGGTYTITDWTTSSFTIKDPYREKMMWSSR